MVKSQENSDIQVGNNQEKVNLLQTFVSSSVNLFITVPRKYKNVITGY